jgi:chromosome segregation ATPase
MPVRNEVSQSEHDLQLKVWKELAISKQMLMRAATDALKLDPECTQDELKAALEALLGRIAKTDAEAARAQAAATASITALESKLATAQHELAAALKAAEEARGAHENALQQNSQQRATAAAELQKVKANLAEREKALKAINVALADTPANVLQKLNSLKKQKQEEADARRTIEATLNALRTEKKQQDQALAELQRNGATLAERHRELHALAKTLKERAEGTGDATAPLPEVPELDATLLEAVEQPAGGQAKRPQLRAVNS